MDSPDNTQEAGLDCHPTETLVRSIDIDETIVQKIQGQNRLDFIHTSADWFQALDDFLHYCSRRRKSKNAVVCSVVDNRILGVLAKAQSGGVSTTRGRFAKVKKGEGVIISPSILFRNVVLGSVPSAVRKSVLFEPVRRLHHVHWKNSMHDLSEPPMRLSLSRYQPSR